MIRMSSRQQRPPVIISIATFAAITMFALRCMNIGNSFVMMKVGSTPSPLLEAGGVFQVSPPQLRDGSLQSPSAFQCLGSFALIVGMLTASRRITTRNTPARRQVKFTMMAQPKWKGPSNEFISGLLKKPVLDSAAASFAGHFEVVVPPMQTCIPVEDPSAFVGCSCQSRTASAARCVGGRRRGSSSRSSGHSFKFQTRSQRRRVGCRLQAHLVYEGAPASFDISRVRSKIQLGLCRPRVARGRESQSRSCPNGLTTQTESWVAISCVLLCLDRAT